MTDNVFDTGCFWLLFKADLKSFYLLCCKLDFDILLSRKVSIKVDLQFALRPSTKGAMTREGMVVEFCGFRLTCTGNTGIK